MLVPVTVCRTTTLSPSAITSSTVTCRSGKARSSIAHSCFMASRGGASIGIGVRNRASGSTSSSIVREIRARSRVLTASWYRMNAARLVVSTVVDRVFIPS